MNRIFENGKELKTAEELGDAFYKILSKKVKRHPYELERIQGSMCSCSGDGVFDLLPLDDEAVIEGGKRYMQCRKCGRFSHL